MVTPSQKELFFGNLPKTLIKMLEYLPPINYWRLILILLLTFYCTKKTIAQDSSSIISYDTKVDYEIGRISIVGANHTKEEDILKWSGLKVGDKIRVPSRKIRNVVKAILRSNAFSNVEIIKEKKIGDVIFLQIQVQELPILHELTITGIPETQKRLLKQKLNGILKVGQLVSDKRKKEAYSAVKQHCINQGFWDVTVNMFESEPASIEVNNGTSVQFIIDLKQKIKLKQVVFEGNEHYSDKQLLKQMLIPKTGKGKISKSKFYPKYLDSGKEQLKNFYLNEGYRDVKVLNDSLHRTGSDTEIKLSIALDEGPRYYFGKISWKGHTKFSTETLNKILNLKEGAAFNWQALTQRLNSDKKKTIKSLYVSNGYESFNAEPTILGIENETLDVVIIIYEGPKN